MNFKDSEIVKKLKIKRGDKVLDVGGSMNQHAEIEIDTLCDIIRPEDAPYGPSILKAKKFVRADFTRDKLPFKDKEFDVCLCTHTLEDLPSPFLIMDEMSRVAKRGVIVTPSMGYDIQFTPFDFTDWLTGSRRVPGEAHHKWFFVKGKDGLEVIPKNYAVLYTSDFQVSKWKGESEMIYVWSGKIKYSEFLSLNMHSLIDKYKNFYIKNRNKIVKGRVLYFVDNPFTILRAFLKLIFKKGAGYRFRKNV
jgi:hypothetical protein